MPDFNYVALTNDGKEAKGVLAADTAERVRIELRRMDLMPVTIQEQSALSKDISLGLFARKPKVRDLSVFCRQFVSILDAGVPVVSALKMLAEQTENSKLSEAINDTRLSVEKGESLAEAMNRHVDIFGSMFISLIKAGEVSGSLSISLARMAEQFEKDARIRAMTRKATIYPIIMLIVTIVVVIVLLTTVIPTFEDIFLQLGTELPGITVMVVVLSEFMQSYWYIVIGLLVAAVVLLRIFSRTPAGRRLFSRLTLMLPIFKNHAVKTNSARMTRTMSTLLGSGIPLLEALEITASSLNNVFFRDALLEARDEVAMGGMLSESLRRTGVFPPLVYQMLAIGEESGDSEGMLSRIADYYDEEVEAATASLMAMLEPMIIIVMAVVVCTIIFAALLPMAQMYGALDTL